MNRHPFIALPALLLLVLACGQTDDGDEPTPDPLDAPSTLHEKPAWQGTPWQPSKVLQPVTTPTRRGLLDLRGLIHAHSPYSHDACDGKPFDDEGKINQPCYEDFRNDLCKVRHNFAMLTDHPTHFRDHPFPDVLLYQKHKGDKLIQRDGGPVANRVLCGDGFEQLLMAGTETSSNMPVGLEGHVPGGVKVRGAAYSDETEEAANKLKKQNAVLLVAHTEDHSVDELVERPLDGFEMFNLHANMVAKMAEAAQLLSLAIGKDKDKAPHPDLAVLPLLHEDPEYTSRWGSVLARGVRRVTTMGTDCHRNTLPIKLADGERVDSYRRMMIWFSNHLLVKPKDDGSWDDRSLKDALRAGRLYGVFEVFGYAEGFDFVALTGASGDEKIHEMGSDLKLADKPTLRLRMPTIAHLDDKATPPELTARLLRAKEGGWDEVASGSGDLSHVPDKAGAYRAEVRIRPHHLEKLMGGMVDVSGQDFAWVYSNAIYVTDKNGLHAVKD